MASDESAVRPAEGQPPTLVYRVVSEHWSHAEQVRWTLLYNLLVANTILLLAWAAIFSASSQPGSRVALIALCAAGLLVSVLWVFLEDRANGFVDMYSRAGRNAEQTVSATPGPFSAAHEHRNSLHGISAFVRTSRVVIWVPLIFVGLFLVLGVLSVCVTLGDS